MATSASKTSWTQLRVGLTALFAMCMLAVLVFYMTSGKSFFRKEVMLSTFMENAGGLARGQAVRLNGLPAGEIEKVELSGDPRPERTVRITFRVDENLLKDIPADSTVMIGSENLLSGRFLAIIRGRGAATAAANGELRSRVLPEIDDMKEQGVKLLAQANDILAKVDGIVKQVEVGKGTIGKLLVDETLYNKLLLIGNDVQKLTTAINSGKGMIGKLVYDDKLYTQFEKTMGRIDTMVADLQAGNGTAGKLLKDTALYDEMRKTITETRRIIEDINAGKGTAGKLLKDDQLHNQLAVSLKKIDGMLDSVNSGKGTLGQLMVNQQLYDNLNGVTREMQGLMKDFRANPKKFLSIKLGLF
jgi:phospholipid/cholesterol/gamma-HCH transport system substrate-binding protein